MVEYQVLLCMIDMCDRGVTNRGVGSPIDDSLTIAQDAIVRLVMNMVLWKTIM